MNEREPFELVYAVVASEAQDGQPIIHERHTHATVRLSTALAYYDTHDASQDGIPISTASPSYPATYPAACWYEYLCQVVPPS